jgi:fatty-acyl-CoA synthase
MFTRVYDWIAHHANQAPEQVAMVDLFSAREFTYAQFDERVGCLAGYLRTGLGVERGDRVAVLSANSTDIFEIQFACFRLGAVFLPLNWRLAPPELEYIVGDSTPKVLLCDEDNLEVGRHLQNLLGTQHIVDVRGDGSTSDYEIGIAESLPVTQMIEQTHDDICTLLYTSGTTGRPKGAIITHAMVFWNATNLGIPMAVSADTSFLTVLPLFHTAGLNCNANPVFHAGGRVLVMRMFEPAQALALIGDETVGVTHFFGVPAIYLFMAQQPDFESADLSRLRGAGVGGAPISTALIEAWTSRGVKLQQGYGMTETSPAVLFLRAADCERKIGSAGKPVLHGETRVVNEDGTEVSPGEVGELWVRGSHITPGYWNRPEATAEAITHGWLHTGDAARIDEDGFYFIVDRWKDMYISGGENVYPAEVEEVLYQLPMIAEAAVVGVADDKWGEVGCAVIVVKEGQRLDETEILAHCVGRLARYKQPKSVVFLEALPRNATGKVLKHELRDQVGGIIPA